MGYPHGLLLIFAIFWLALAIRLADRKVWATENSFTLLLVLLLAFTYPNHPLSRLSYTLIYAFLCLHTVGGHYTYSKVPYDRWFAALSGGRTLSERLGLMRNHYDRLVHLCFGLLLVYPVYEVLARYARPAGPWAYFLAVALIMAFSMLFELIEWGAATVLGGGAGQDYVAAQGDEWDAQKDMAAATLGAALAIGGTAAAHAWT